MTVLDRLAKKELVTRVRDGRAWRYLAADSREALTAQTMRRTLDDMEVTNRRAALMHFLDGATEEEIEDVRSALAEIDDRRSIPGSAAPSQTALTNTPAPMIALLLVTLAAVLAWPAPG